MLKYFLKILLVLSLGVVVSCAKRNPEPITSEDFIKSAEDDLAKIQEIKEQNDLFNKNFQTAENTQSAGLCKGQNRLFSLKT